MNHVWRILFGTGIVKTSNDFGVRGEVPTHLELLDWLAAKFIGLASHDTTELKAWSRKSLIKLIVMSATYRLCLDIGRVRGCEAATSASDRSRQRRQRSAKFFTELFARAAHG